MGFNPLSAEPKTARCPGERKDGDKRAGELQRLRDHLAAASASIAGRTGETS